MTLKYLFEKNILSATFREFILILSVVMIRNCVIYVPSAPVRFNY